MKFVVSLLICFSLAMVARGQFCCNDFKTALNSDQVCNGISECPMTETTPGGEDEDSCEGTKFVMCSQNLLQKEKKRFLGNGSVFQAVEANSKNWTWTGVKLKQQGHLAQSDSLLGLFWQLFYRS